MAWRGRYLVIGFTAGEIPRLPLNLVLLKGCAIVGVFFGGFAAAEPARYDAYAAAIRQEFIHVPEADYRAGRAKVLGQFAARPVIFPDTAFAARYDRQARENLARELASLR